MLTGLVLTVEQLGWRTLIPAIIVGVFARMAAGRPGLYRLTDQRIAEPDQRVDFVPRCCDNREMNGDWWFLTILWCVTLAVIAFGTRSVSPERLDRWQRRFDVRLDDRTTPMVRRRLRTGSSVRWVSFLVGLHITALPMYFNIIDAHQASRFVNPLVSNAFFFTTALCAAGFEFAVRQRSRGGEALIVRRRRSDYVDRWWSSTTVVCSAVAVAAAFVATWREPFRWRYAWVGAAAGVMAVAIIRFGVSRIIDRPALSAAGGLRDADEAMRADGVHHIVGAAVAPATTGASTAAVIAIDNSWLTIPFALLPWFGISWWSRLWLYEPWSVRRAREAHV